MNEMQAILTDLAIEFKRNSAIMESKASLGKVCGCAGKQNRIWQI